MKNIKKIKFPKVTGIIVAINVFVFLLGEFVISKTGYDIREALCLRYWGGDAFHPLQFLTSMFTHASYGHLIGNMVFLSAFGTAIENSIGKLKYLALYLGGGLIAGAVPIILYHFGVQELLEVLRTFLENPTLEAATLLTGNPIPEFMLALVIMMAKLMYGMLLNGPAFLGASGAVSVVMGLSLLTHANTSLFKDSFVKLWMIVALMFYRDAYSVINDIIEGGMLGGVSGQMAHLTGYLVGFAYVAYEKLKGTRIKVLKKK